MLATDVVWRIVNPNRPANPSAMANWNAWNLQLSNRNFSCRASSNTTKSSATGRANLTLGMVSPKSVRSRPFGAMEKNIVEGGY